MELKVVHGLLRSEKAYDRVDGKRLQKVLRAFGVNSKLLNAVNRFYNDSKACVNRMAN